MESDEQALIEEDKWKGIPVYLMRESQKNEIILEVSTTFGLLFESRLSTGFSWTLKTENIGEAVRFICETDHESDDRKEEKFGSTDYQKFVFKSFKAGELELKFIYSRPWEKGKKPEKIILVKIIVEK